MGEQSGRTGDAMEQLKPVEDVVEESFTIIQLEKLEGPSGPYIVVDGEFDGVGLVRFWSDSQVLMSKLDAAKDDLPLEACIVIKEDDARHPYSDFLEGPHTIER